MVVLNIGSSMLTLDTSLGSTSCLLQLIFKVLEPYGTFLSVQSWHRVKLQSSLSPGPFHPEPRVSVLCLRSPWRASLIYISEVDIIGCGGHSVGGGLVGKDSPRRINASSRHQSPRSSPLQWRYVVFEKLRSSHYLPRATPSPTRIRVR